ncbi:hypothetical protein [Devosia naphthalenivorans]|uniref:hypothetical protein n=1 Tax=Devosia naphthalenivorans TaxID=2082392 RepID=UPI0013B04BB2|nr:hypothetical protein [Devosia naphthalenivorans]
MKFAFSDRSAAIFDHTSLAAKKTPFNICLLGAKSPADLLFSRDILPRAQPFGPDRSNPMAQGICLAT